MHADLSTDVMTSFKRVRSTLRSALAEVISRLQAANEEKAGLPRLLRTSEESELTSVLRKATSTLQSARKHLVDIKAEGRLSQPIAWFKASQAVKAAEQGLDDQKRAASSASESARRTQHVAAHNLKVETVAGQIKVLEQTIDQAVAWRASAQQLHAQLDLLEQALLRHGWVSANTAAVLENVLLYLTRRDIAAARQVSANLRFQMMPSQAQIAQWQEETEGFLAVARNEGSVGFTAQASFTSIVHDATALVLAGCVPSVRSDVQQDAEPADRWYHLAHQLTRPDHVSHWVQWALYWANFQTAQRFSKDQSLAHAHEEHSTGGLLSNLRSESERWAGPKIDAMGYPEVTSFLGTLALGGTAAEAHLGADFGIIVDINVGGLVVRKVALVQGKVSKNGKADIASKPTGPMKLTQLEKLHDPQRDFYAFYHRGLRGASIPWPTVNRACALTTPTTDLRAAQIIISTRESGWDWPSFIAFGLCSNTSGVGRMLEEHEDALAVLSSGRRELLPGRLIVVAAGGGDYSLELQHRVSQHYKTMGTSYRRDRDKDHGPKNRGQGLSR
ncbi:hypothetical protein [Pseudomonas antarctica]|uniref:hypothetical protein n=1 Tax=Pseudomonas antarctica TaxID=219572 RepID=UPI00387B19B5